MKRQWRINLFLGIMAAFVSGQLACARQSSETPSPQSPSPLAAVSASPTPGGTSDLTPAAPIPGNPTAAAPAAPEKPQPPRIFTLPAGRSLSIFTSSTLSTKSNKSGEAFTASLARPIVDGDWVIAKKGASVEGVIVKSDPGGRVKGRASMAVRLKRLALADGREVELSTSSYGVEARGTKKKDAMKIGIGAGVGAIIGGLAGGGKGAAIGAGAGGGAGTGLVLATRGAPAVIPSESQLSFKLTAPITVTKQ
jgi:hypothetical protein